VIYSNYKGEHQWQTENIPMKMALLDLFLKMKKEDERD